ncbi:SIMPL domain-containing protein [Aspergillus chevalieri]|uniref:SIMPL domain-containing protein n=1 Tax=Aspergillus chevalieri TaxID=182096 RepID=A0A7R7ZS34_ASPCH|nr:uncharacterized protein ACHE_70214S [Aspergillus chevalieri]BCR91371.1 hypothetical protein ACHE_70214S [Aspergillus chevalieri]
MTPITINVTGSSTIHQPPERAVLFFHVQSEGSSSDTVSKEVTATSNQLQQIFKGLKSNSLVPTPVAAFSTSSLRRWSERPRDRDGNPGERVHYAQLRFEATFREFKKLSEVAGRLSAYPNVAISNIDWRLTDETKQELGSKTRKLAMKDAIQKAFDYAEVIGREVNPVEITDMESPGLHSPRYMAAMAACPMEDEREELDLTPQDVELTSSIQVNFRGE